MVALLAEHRGARAPALAPRRVLTLLRRQTVMVQVGNVEKARDAWRACAGGQQQQQLARQGSRDRKASGTRPPTCCCRARRHSPATKPPVMTGTVGQVVGARAGRMAGQDNWREMRVAARAHACTIAAEASPQHASIDIEWHGAACSGIACTCTLRPRADPTMALACCTGQAKHCA